MSCLQVSLPNLKVLKISKLENLETLGHDSLSVGSLSKLEEFSVGDCGKLLCVFPSQSIPMLRNLERLTVESCHLLEVVFELEGVDTKEPNPDILPALNVVKLRDLPKLIYISKEDPIGFKYIQTLKIDGCHSLSYVFAPTVMKSISQLCKLKIRGCKMLSRIVAEENGMGESSVDEVKFPQLETLELHDLPNLASLFPNVNIDLPKSTDRLHNQMQPQSLFNEKVAIPSLKYLELVGLKNVSDLGCSELPSSSFSKLEKLKVIGCTSLRNMFHPSMAGGFVNLKELLIHFCSTLEAVVGKEEEVEGGNERKIDKVEFPQLERLELHDLPNLVSLFQNVNIALPKSTNRLHNPMLPQSLFNEKVAIPSLKYLELHGLKNVSDLWCSELPSSSFSKLEKLKVIGCTSLRNMFHPSIAGGFVNLKELLIHFCFTLEAVVGKEEEVEGGNERKIDKVEFPQLERLELHDLPNLVSLFLNVNIALPKSTNRLHNPMLPQSLFNEKVAIPSLKYLELHGLKNVIDLWCSELPSSPFSKLEKLKVIGCTRLRNMFHPSMAGGFVNLKELLIHFCSTLEAVVGKEEEVEGGNERKIDKVEFPQLERLELHDLPNLVSLFLNVNIALPKSTNRLHNPMLPQSLFNEKVAIPSLKYLELHGLKNVSDLWCSELPSSLFSKLEKLKVIGCTSLRNMFHPSMAGGFENLKELLIHFCSTLEVVVGKEEEVEGGHERKIDKVEFPQLERLELHDLPNLVSLFQNVNIALPKSTNRLHNPMLPQSLFNEKVAIPSLKYLELHRLKNVSDLWCSELPSSSFSKLEQLKVIRCTSLRNVFYPSMAGGGTTEEDNGGSDHGGDGGANSGGGVAILSLKYLELVGLKNVSDLGCSELSSSSFSKLEKLIVIDCPSLKNMFHPSMAGDLVNLKELLIKDCSTLEAVVGKEEEVEGGHERKIVKVEFPQLESLGLCDLPNLVSLFLNVNIALPKSTDRLHNPMQPQSLINEKVAIPSLKYLRLLGLKNVSDLWCSELPSSSFSKLENLKVIGCASLKKMFHPSMSRGLVNLKELLIEVCSTLEVVVGKEEVVGGGHGSKIDKTLFPLLGKLKLGSLPNLKRFCNSTHPLELPKLSQMDILFCPSMDAFSSEPVCAPNLTLQGISWNGDLNNAIQFLRKNGNDPMARSMEKPRTLDDVTDKFKPWQVAETRCRLVAMPDSTDEAHKVFRLLYTNSGNGVLALGCNGIMRLWKWGDSQHNPSGMATASVVLQRWQPASGLVMTNAVTGAKLEEAVPCMAVLKNSSSVFLACGVAISLFDPTTFKIRETFMPPPPASTFLAFYPRNNHIIAIGREDSTICIYNDLKDKVICILKGHQKRITGLAFSTNLKILVSSGADAQLCIWSTDTWVKLKSVPIQLPAGKPCDCDTGVQFHSRQIRLLVFHETQLAIYDASKMDRIRQWVPQDVLPAPISCATYSCARYSYDNQLVYVSFCDGNIGVFDADSLTLRCHITPSVYLSPALLSGSQPVYPLVVAAHPHQPNQFAIGLTDGSVIVMKLPTITGLDGGTASSSNSSNQTPGPEEDVDVDEDVDEDALITNRSRVRTATMGTNDNEEDFEEKRKKEEEERKKKKGKAPLLDEHEEY
ncbi:hypothetical protein Vadar_004184 [Vaccinium darrowii]|uniref:Uncharacterized protein n=1 Tax=Vaccinium darrowii TaxID=229202 RepID=A0ACB7YL36_9ERIC|nr:hypothetical protein Vadar_004184 [Vaccinium darrowii]